MTTSDVAPEPVLTIDVQPDLGELVAVILFEHGALAVGEEPGGDQVRLRAGFATQDAATAAAAAVAQWGSPIVALIAPTWHDDQRSGFSPVEVGPWHIRAPWHDPHVPNDLRSIVIEPGRAFGHGAHPTTRMMLELLPDWLSPDANVLDVGTGTGVLAIAAATLGAIVTGIDNDPEAIAVAHQNVAANSLEGAVTLLLQDGSELAVTSGFDVVLINVTIDQHRLVAPFVSSTTTAIVSGLLEQQLDEATALYGRQPSVVIESDGWVAAVLAAG
jgi:ribosomal protein L11 methyltransferase